MLYITACDPSRAMILSLCLAWLLVGCATRACWREACSSSFAEPGKPPSRLPLAGGLWLRGGCSSNEPVDISGDVLDEKKGQKKTISKELRRRGNRNKKGTKERDYSSEEGLDSSARRREGKGSGSSSSIEAEEQITENTIQAVRYCDHCGVPSEYCAYVGCIKGKATSPRGDNAGNATDSKEESASVSKTMQASVEALGSLSLSGADTQEHDEVKSSRQDKPSPSERKGHMKKAAERAKVGSSSGTDPYARAFACHFPLAWVLPVSTDKAPRGCGPQVVIKVSSRGRRKHVTVVTGLEAHLPPGKTLKSVAKTMATRFACSASVGLFYLPPPPLCVLASAQNLQRMPLETLPV